MSAKPSQWVGKISEKLTVAVVCTWHATFEARDRFRGGYTTMHRCRFEDADGNIFVTKSDSFAVKQGSRGWLTGQVKQHDDWKGIKQTILRRPKFAVFAAFAEEG
jgi:hypothetical protein